MSSNREGDIISTIYTRLQLEPSKYKWVRNAVAKFDSNPPPPDPRLENFKDIRSKISEKMNTHFDYETIKQASELNLGPSCQTVSRQIWKNPDDDSEYLLTFKCHETRMNF